MTYTTSTFDDVILEKALEVRRFICPECSRSSLNYIMIRSEFLHLECDECNLHYFWDWGKDSFRELGPSERKLGEPVFELLEE